MLSACKYTFLADTLLSKAMLPVPPFQTDAGDPEPFTNARCLCRRRRVLAKLAVPLIGPVLVAIRTR